METPTRQEQIEKTAELIKDIGIAFLTTIAADGTLHSRPMGTVQKRFDGTLWFFTSSSSGKVEEVQREQQVAVTYSNPSKQDYVAISGLATTSRDKAKMQELWNPTLKIWFPKGLEDPEIALLQIDVKQVEYWDAPSSTFVYLYGLAKVAITGKSPTKMGEHEAFSLSGTGSR